LEKAGAFFRPTLFERPPRGANASRQEADHDLHHRTSAFRALLKNEGVTHFVGNPGATELPIMHALKDHPEITFFMAM
jgi:hypothetical protein